MDKLFGLFFVIALILYLVAAILPFIAIILGICLVVFLIYRGIKLIVDKRKTKEQLKARLTSFLKEFSQVTSKNYDFPEKVEDLQSLCANEVVDFISKTTVPSQTLNSFVNLSDRLSRLYKTTSWAANSVNNTYYEQNGSSLSRFEVTNGTNDQLGFALFDGVKKVSISINDKTFVFTPFFIVLIERETVSIFKWETVKTGNVFEITVRENVFFGMKGASPIYHRYLHERVNGGPDRRYNYNPATPVYRYSVMDFTLPYTNKLICCDSGLPQSLEKTLNNFKMDLVNNPINST